MSNEPIFQNLAREYAMTGKTYEWMTTPHLSPVRALSGIKTPVTNAPVYGPNEHLDGPYKAPLPRRTLAEIIKLPEPNPDFTRMVQEYVSTAPLTVLQGTRAGSVLSSFQSAFRGVSAGPVIVDEAIRYEERFEGVVVTKTITVEELLDGITSADIIQELGQEFAEKYPNASVMEVNVGEKLNGDMIVTVRGTLISEEDNTSTPNNPEQTDESVNAASNEENDDEDEPVFVAPNFWKIRDEE